ncbi:hypothetical protein LB559_09180 [Mesorhizobium sp. BR1-1-3]|uniref:hypothetical protein n=1 Tax=Mesorhizobium sp. BR1-1-3 TaxID=2876651 RepID=UPI001CD056E0|nr:hypothetical protein [Mesorhizobium sp. BR1-1-3]MBZ9888111.1 hypothetical protein [Mesorhizobium sp. BR1-1-3]
MARHADFADQLLAWRNKPEGPIEPVKTNWTVVPANDNAEPEEIVDYGFERHLRITPSVEEIMRHVATGPEARNEDGAVVAIGRLRFSDGNQTEKAYCYGPEGKLIQYDAPMPLGAMLGTRDKPDGQLGGAGFKLSDVERSNNGLAALLDTDYPIYVKGTTRKNGPGYSRNESVEILAAAYANTPVLPTVKHYPPGLPCGSTRPYEAFVGIAKGKKGESGAIAWEDVASSMVSREIWDATLRFLADEDIATLDTAMTAKNMREIGEAHGFVGKRAERMGKQILSAANDNLAEARAISA